MAKMWPAGRIAPFNLFLQPLLGHFSYLKNHCIKKMYTKYLKMTPFFIINLIMTKNDLKSVYYSEIIKSQIGPWSKFILNMALEKKILTTPVI